MIRNTVLPSGYRCDCGKFHKFPSYVFAHWRQSIRHACDRCETIHTIFAGEVIRVQRPKKTKHVPAVRWTDMANGKGLVYRGRALRIRYDSKERCFVGYIGRERVVESTRGSSKYISDRASMAETLQGLVDQMLSGGKVEGGSTTTD